MSALPGLGGQLWARPGHRPPHNLRSTRPDWVARIAPGRLARTLPPTLGSLFSLCSHAHVLCAGLAVAAAGGGDTRVPDDARRRLQVQTLREHLRRLALDWPAQLSGGGAPGAAAEGAGPSVPPVADGMAWSTCPMWSAGAGPTAAAHPATLDATAAWLERHLFGQPLAVWLDAWLLDPLLALSRWAQATPGPVPGLLRRLLALDDDHLPRLPPLRLHADDTNLRDWALLLPMAATPDQRALWQGAPADTGVWSRLAGPDPAVLDTLALRVGARLADIARLALPDVTDHSGADWLSAGALPLGNGQAVAWVEMSRGLLLHRVALDGRGPDARVLDCQVLSPTDWNFHPLGGVAQALARLPMVAESASGVTPSRLNTLLAAYDPCMPCEIDTHPLQDAVPAPAHA